MRAGFDGSINIDTSIDASNFSKGMKLLGKISLNALSPISGYFKRVAENGKELIPLFTGGWKTVGQAITGVAATLGTVTTILGTIIGILGAIAVVAVFAGIAFFAWAQKMTNTLYKNLNTASAFRSQVVGLKTAFDSLKGSTMALGATLLSIVAPVIQKIINWLIQAINWVNMFIAALAGKSTYMKYVSGSVDKAANSTGAAANNTDKLAKNTKKAAQEAKGALASFDQINVLQQETADLSEGMSSDLGNGGSGGSGTAGNITMEEAQVNAGVKTIADKIKDGLKKAWDWVKQAAIDTWNWIKQAAIDTWDFLKTKVFEPIGAFFAGVWAWIKQAAIDAWNWIKEAWQNVAAWFNEKVITPLLNFFTPIWNFITIVAYDAWLVIKMVWEKVSAWFKEHVLDPIGKFFSDAWMKIKTIVSGVWDSIRDGAGIAWMKIKEIWGVVTTWFKEHITDPVKEKFDIALESIRNKFETIFNGIKNIVKGIFNEIIDLINGVLQGSVSGINGFIRVANSAGSKIGGWKNIPEVTAPQIPRLATGAVIPPNAQFLAMLGDQRHGTNIEAPLDTIKQAMSEVLGGGGGEMTIPITLTLDGEVIYQNQKKIQWRRGTSLIMGGNA